MNLKYKSRRSGVQKIPKVWFGLNISLLAHSLFLPSLSKKLYDILHLKNLITNFLVSLTMSSFLESRELRKHYKEVREYVKIGPIFLTRYEKARILGARALQLSCGAPMLIEKPADVIDPIKIAQLELKAKILPLTIRREYPNGEYQDIYINKLILKKD